MADFQELGIKLEAIDNASDKLQKVVDLLEKIKKLTSSGGVTTVGSGSSINNIVGQASSLRTVASLYNKLKVAAEGATNAEISLINAQNREIIAAENYKNAQNKKTRALQRLAAAQERLKSAKSDYDLMTGSGADWDKLSDEQKSRYNLLEEQGFSEIKATQQLESAKRAVASAQNSVVTATQSENSAYASLISAQNGVATATNNLRKEQEKQEQQMKKNTYSFVKFAAKMTVIVATIRRLSRGLFSAVEESGAFVENLNLFAVTFGDNYQETLDWALDFAENLGVAANEVVRFTGLFKQLSDSIGIADEMGDQMSQTLTQLGYDLASFYNIDTESAMEKLQAGIFSGQTKPLIDSGSTQRCVDKLFVNHYMMGVAA